MTRATYLCCLLGMTLAGCGDRGRAASSDREITRSDAAADVPAAGDTPIEITAVVEGRELRATGLGECQHAADGSIYERPASLWTARFDGPERGDIRHLSVAFWRERSGAESVNLALQAGEELHRIATVEGGEKQGSGSASLEGDAAAGTLVVTGTSAEGKSVEVRAKCSRFTTMVAEGG